ncbi:THUMP domain-containing protein 1 homolog isoform X2 [Bacillus rossius redtenbacheri]|uniref:THUMP domain-containing protein 1 homolog isoform X2 n=1 Tax=Bacillus rossius redtenbacheri TaxID=93214 RepID=UPI002FDDE2F8
MSSSNYQKRKKPYYNYRTNKKQKEFVLKAGLKGFLCTCNAREGDCIREAYNILNEYSEKLNAENPQENVTEDAMEERETGDDEGEDIDEALEKELSSLKDEANKKPGQRKFQVVESGAKNCLFIQTTIPDPVKLALSIVEDLNDTKAQKCRFLQRLLPIEATCKATMEDVRAALEPLLDKYFAKESKTFAVMFTRRNSSALDREEVIKQLAEMVTLRSPGSRADLKSPQLSVMVEVMRGTCCLAVLPDYFRLRKYNLLELAAPEKREGDRGADPGSGSEEGAGDARETVRETGDAKETVGETGDARETVQETSTPAEEGTGE